MKKKLKKFKIGLDKSSQEWDDNSVVNRWGKGDVRDDPVEGES